MAERAQPALPLSKFEQFIDDLIIELDDKKEQEKRAKGAEKDKVEQLRAACEAIQDAAVKRCADKMEN
eukprot:IDg1538t1